METIVNTYGVLLRKETRYGYEYIIAEIVKREGNHHAPRNCSDGYLCGDTDRPKHLQNLQLNGLRMQGSVCDIESRPFGGYEAEYRDVFSVHLPDAERMVRTLKLITARVQKDAAYTAPDYFASFCAALRLSFVVVMHGEPRGSSYDNADWRWLTIGEGRNRYRDMIETARKVKEAA